MKRSLVVVFCVFCVATLLSELLAAGLLWYRGQLTSATLHEMRLLLSGQVAEEELGSVAVDDVEPSTADAMEARVRRLFDIDSRESELVLLRDLLNQRKDELRAEREKILRLRKELDDRLRELEERSTDEATEQTRGILLTLRPDDAVHNLMQLDLERNVVLLRGLPDKTVGKILGEFNEGTEEQRQRGNDIFEALSRGEPKRRLLDDFDTELTKKADPDI